MKIGEILSSEGDSINVYIPIEFFAFDSPVLVNQIVYGGRPYSPKSDILAICAHMGILFPGEKLKRHSPDILFTAPSASLFGRKPNSPIDDAKKIEDDFRLFGVVVAVVAVEGSDYYPPIQGYSLSSQESNEVSMISIDILDYSFISEFEPIPDIIEDPNTIIKHNVSKEYFHPELDTDFIEYDYSPDLFKDDTEGFLFQDYIISFIYNTSHLQFRPTRKGFILVERLIQKDGVETDLQIIESNVQFRDIRFTERGFVVKEKNYEPIHRLVLRQNDQLDFDE